MEEGRENSWQVDGDSHPEWFEIYKFFEVNFFSSGPRDQPVLHFVQQLKRRTVKLTYGLNTKSHLGQDYR